MLLQQRPVLWPYDLHALAAEILGGFGGVLHLPATLAPAPVHDGLIDAAFLDAMLLGGLTGKRCGHSRATGQFDEVTTGKGLFFHGNWFGGIQSAITHGDQQKTLFASASERST